MSKQQKIIILLLTAVLILTGCSMTTVEQMYRLPKRSDAYNDLQIVIENAMSGLEYCAPLTGENQQTVQMADLNGDGQQEYILFAKGTQDKPLHIIVFSKVEESFVNTCSMECNGSAFDQVEYVDMNGDGGMEIVVGRQLSDQVIRSVCVYTFEENELIQLVSTNYSKFLTADIDADNRSELFVLRPGQTETDNGIAELYSMKHGNMERYNEVNLSRPADQLKRIIVGKLDGGKTAVYVASRVGDTALQTDVFTILEGKLTNVTLSKESGTDIQTMRNFYVYADDIDNDSVVELPSLMVMKPLREGTSDDMHHLIRWYAMTTTGDEIDKMYTYHNFVGGWYMQQSSQWASRLTVIDTGNQTEFYLWDKHYQTAQKLMTVFAFTGSNREEQGLTENRFILHKTDSVVYAALLESAAADCGITQENAVYSFRMIQQDWKTGET